MNHREMFPDFFRLARNLKARLANLGGYHEGPEGKEVDIEEANLLTSEHTLGLHRVVIDLDMDAALIPSSTPGHHHLIINQHMTWEQYVRLLRALAEAEIIEEGYLNASISKGYTAIRVPWVHKEDEKPFFESLNALAEPF